MPAPALYEVQAGQVAVLRRLPPAPEGMPPASLRPVPLSSPLPRLPRMPRRNSGVPHLKGTVSSFLTWLTNVPPPVLQHFNLERDNKQQHATLFAVGEHSCTVVRLRRSAC